MKFDVVVIGGSAAGIIAAKNAKLSYPDKSVLIIRKEEISLVPCGIPYIFSRLNSIDENIMGIDPIKKIGVEFLIEEVTKIDPEKHEVVTANNTVSYSKLVIATGSTPVVPGIRGVDSKGIFVIPKDYNYLANVLSYIKDSKNIVVVGAGFIGVEISDEFKDAGKNVTLIESQDRVLPLAFDEDISKVVEDKLISNGVNIKVSSKVEEFINENGKVTGVKLNDGSVIKADAVILSVGYRPNTELAKSAGLMIGINDSIWADEYLRTSVKDIFAAGDCVEHKDFFTRKSTKLMLASTATFDARIAGCNLFGLKVIRENKGNISIFSSAINGLAFGAAGITATTAKEGDFEIEIGKFSAIDRHPGTLKDKSEQTVKLVFSKNNGILLGAQVITGNSAGELINILGLAIQQNMTALDLATLQVGTHPLLTAAPT
ncbi:MAG: FAD-dependent oxidoreductase, partial [Deltaproteobacteria bacterium]|nr:FAD-dependent oxidoreductase [Deltaproteobacteria bacterium]